MVLIGPDTRPSFPALRETKGVDCERGTKTPATPLKNETNRGARRESVTRIEEQTGGPARINQISALSVRKSDSCGVASLTRGGGGERGQRESVNEFVRNPRSFAIETFDFIRRLYSRLSWKKKRKVKDHGGVTGTKIYLNRFWSGEVLVVDFISDSNRIQDISHFWNIEYYVFWRNWINWRLERDKYKIRKYLKYAT